MILLEGIVESKDKLCGINKSQIESILASCELIG